jgi:general secretion pathway protein G
MRDRSPITAAQADINGGIKSALGQYAVDNGFLPTSLKDLVQQSSSATNWHGPYLDSPKLAVDPWGHEYIYEFPGKHNPGSYDLISVGPDGKKGTEDDIGNW